MSSILAWEFKHFGDILKHEEVINRFIDYVKLRNGMWEYTPHSHTVTTTNNLLTVFSKQISTLRNHNHDWSDETIGRYVRNIICGFGTVTELSRIRHELSNFSWNQDMYITTEFYMELSIKEVFVAYEEVITKMTKIFNAEVVVFMRGLYRNRPDMWKVCRNIIKF